MFPHQIYDTLRVMTQTCITRHRMYAYERLKITWVYVRLGIRKCISGHSGECSGKNFSELLDKMQGWVLLYRGFANKGLHETVRW